MQKRVKMKTILFSIGMLLISVAAALLFMLVPKKVEAKADETNFAWLGGAAAATNTYSTSVYRLRFQLNVSETAFTAEDDMLAITFGEYTGGNPGTQHSESIKAANGAWIRDLEFMDNESETWYSSFPYILEEQIVIIEKADMVFDDGKTCIGVDVAVGDLRQDIVLTANVYGADGTLKQHAISDTRNVLYIWEKAIEAEDPAIIGNPYITEVVDFINTVDSADFVMGTSAQLSEERGLTLQLHIPEEMRNLLYSPKEYPELIVHGPGGLCMGTTIGAYSYVDYVLCVNFAPNTEELSNPSVSDKRHLERYFFSASGETFGTLPTYKLPDSLKTHGDAIVDLPIPSRSANFVYAYIVKITTKPELVKETSNILCPHTLANTYEFEIVHTTENAPIFSVNGIATEMLENNLSLGDYRRAWLMHVSGQTPSTETVPVTIKYKAMSSAQNQYGDIVEKTHTFYVPAVCAFTKALVMSELCNNTEYKHVSRFNIIYQGDYYENGTKFNTEERIILQANSYTYKYRSADEMGTLTVVYDEFKYKDLNIRITNNDWANHLTLNWYTANVTQDGDFITLTFDYETIQEHLYNSCMWLFQMKAENIAYNTVDGVAVTATDKAVSVTFAEDNEDALQNLSLTAVAEILEDYYLDVTCKYAQYVNNDGTLAVETVYSEPFTILYSQWVSYNYDSFMQDHGDEVLGALEIDILEGDYYIPYNFQKNLITPEVEGEYPTGELIILYEYNSIYKITDNIHNGARYKSLTQTTPDYKGDFFVAQENIPAGYRISSIASTSNAVKVTPARNYADTSVYLLVNQYQNLIIPITVTYTDLWNVSINYMKQISNTPFAELKAHNTTVKVSDYEDIYALTKEDVKSILGLSTFDITGSVTVDQVSVSFDNVDTYTVDLTYSHASLKQINYEGEQMELKIPLTSYADWCEAFGKDWSILMLNTEKKTYFKYSNDVARDKLYGLFSVAIFDEQVSDLNYWFKNVTGDGSVEVFTENQVKGSDTYKFFNNLRTKGFVSSVVGHVGMAVCELVDDSNTMQYMHYFYLDGTNPNGGYIANGGADDADDTDDALTNKGEDIKEDVEDAVDNAIDTVVDLINSIGNKDKEPSAWEIVLCILLGIVAAVAFAAAIYWLLNKSGILKQLRKKKTAKKTSARAKPNKGKAKKKK